MNHQIVFAKFKKIIFLIIAYKTKNAGYLRLSKKIFMMFRYV